MRVRTAFWTLKYVRVLLSKSRHGLLRVLLPPKYEGSAVPIVYFIWIIPKPATGESFASHGTLSANFMIAVEMFLRRRTTRGNRLGTRGVIRERPVFSRNLFVILFVCFFQWQQKQNEKKSRQPRNVFSVVQEIGSRGFL